MLLRRRGRAVAATLLFAVLAVLGPRTVDRAVDAGAAKPILTLAADLPMAVAATVERTPDRASARDLAPWALLPALLAVTALALTGRATTVHPTFAGWGHRSPRRDRAPPTS